MKKNSKEIKALEDFSTKASLHNTPSKIGQ